MVSKFTADKIDNLPSKAKKQGNCNQFLLAKVGFHLNIESVNYLNYPIESISQILEAHFDEDNPAPANLLVKALKIISLSLKDMELKTQVQTIIENHLTKKQRIYNLYRYWADIAGEDIFLILSKLSQQISTRIILLSFSFYLFSPQVPQSHQMSSNIEQYFQQFSVKQMGIDNELSIQYENSIKYVKNKFMEIGCKLSNFIAKIGYLSIGNPSLFKFLNELIVSMFKVTDIESQLGQLFATSLNSEFRKQLDQFFSCFPSICEYYIQQIKISFTYKNIVQIWSQSGNHKMSHAIRSAVRQWINSDDKQTVNASNFWMAFDYNDDELKKTKNTKKRVQLLEMGLELEKQNMLSEFIVKKGVYNFFMGRNFELAEETQFVESLKKLKNGEGSVYYHRLSCSHVESLEQMVKALSSCSSKGGVNIMVMNKVCESVTWPKINALSQQNKIKIKNCAKNASAYLDKYENLYAKLVEKYEQKGKKLELAYNVLKIQINKEIPTQEVIIVYLALEQLIDCADITKIPSFRDYYVPINTNKRPQIQQTVQLHPIIYEAKIIRQLKKSKKSITFEQLKQRLKITQSIIRTALKKLINKGFAQQTQDSRFCYVP